MTNGQITPNDGNEELFVGEELDLTDSPLEHVQKSSTIGIVGVLIGVVFLVTANVLGAKFGRSGLWITVWRSYMGAAMLIVVVRARKQHITWEAIRYCGPAAVSFTIHIICFYQAIQMATLTNVTIIRSLQPPLLLLFVGANFGERVKLNNVISAVIAFLGVILTVWGTAAAGHLNVGGIALSFVALAAWIAFFITGKQARQHVGTASLMLVATVSSAVVATIILPFTTTAFMPTKVEWIKLLAMAISATLGHGAINWAHRYTKLSTNSLLTLLTPAGSAICAAIFFDQPITVAIAIGIVVVLGSVAWGIIGDTKDKDANVIDADLDNARAA